MAIGRNFKVSKGPAKDYQLPASIGTFTSSPLAEKATPLLGVAYPTPLRYIIAIFMPGIKKYKIFIILEDNKI
jgi:hypothetical protein